jgi:N utilization substance protein B
MIPRRASRELALLVSYQLESLQLEPETITVDRLQELLLGSVRILTQQAQDYIQEAVGRLRNASCYVMEQEQNHPTNLESPLDADLKPVPLKQTSDLAEQIDQCLVASEYLTAALKLPEFIFLSKYQDVQAYAIDLVRLVARHKHEFAALLDCYAEDWKVDRLVKMDRSILYLAMAEMKYIQGVDMAVSINEAIELAKTYSTEESYRFINGILGQLVPLFEGAEKQAEDISRV